MQVDWKKALVARAGAVVSRAVGRVGREAPSSARALALLAAGALLAAAPATRAAGPGAARGTLDQAPAARTVGVLLRMGFDGGGDKLVTVQWDDGSSKTLKAGQLMTFAGGLLYHPGDYAVEGTFGYKFDKVNGSNGSITFSRMPLDLVVSWAPGNHRLGAGPTVHLAPKFDCSATGVCAGTVNFNTAFGGIVQYAYGFPLGNAGMELGARYTVISYKASDGGGSLSGNAIGGFFGFWF